MPDKENFLIPHAYLAWRIRKISLSVMPDKENSPYLACLAWRIRKISLSGMPDKENAPYLAWRIRKSFWDEFQDRCEHILARGRKRSRISSTTTATFVFATGQFRDTKTSRELHPQTCMQFQIQLPWHWRPSMLCQVRNDAVFISFYVKLQYVQACVPKLEAVNE